MPNWTSNQQKAINSTRGSILVSASAGSGKTAVLVERITNRLTDKENPVMADRLLIVTYTKLAATEMKERLIKRLSGLIKADPGNALLRKQQMKLQNAHISTIHSFCNDLVKEYFHTLGISRDFRIAEEGELKILKNQAVNQVLDSQYEINKNEDFINFVEMFSGSKDDNDIAKVIFSLYEFLRSHPFPDEWLDEKLSYYDKDSGNLSIWFEEIFNYTVGALNQALMLCKANIQMISEADEVIREKLTEVCNTDLKLLSAIYDSAVAKDWDDVRNQIMFYSQQRLIVKRGYSEEATKVAISKNRKYIKESIIDNLKKYYFQSKEEMIEDTESLKPFVEEMFRLVKEFQNAYNKIKTEKNILDFSDLEHKTLQLLVKGKENGKIIFSEEAEKIALKFDEVMVDEYQDANEVQDTIFRALSGNNDHLFVVGDVKQSIYGFRQAMPDIFIGRKDSYSLYDEEQDSYPAKIILEKNFRSRQQVIDTVNFMFKRLMSKDCGDIEYNEEETLVCGASYSEAKDTKISLSFVEADTSPELSKEEVEADYIASEIIRIMAEKTVEDKGEIRKPKFSDFAIIMRKTKKSATKYIQRLGKWHIPAVSNVSDTFLLNREIRVIVDLLRVIDNPLLDIPLLSVLMGPLYGFTADELARIRSNDRNRNIYLSLKDNQKKSQKIESFLNDIERFRSYSALLPVNQLVNRIYEETAYLAIIKGMYEGSFQYNNVLLFKDYASAYEKSGLKGLSSFVNYIDNLIKQETDLTSGKNSSSSDLNAVSVLSIHKSKGLEYPIVFLANTTTKFVSDATRPVLIHKELGFSVKKRDLENQTVYNTLPRLATSFAIKNSEKSEELRILYVALTRAKEELHMVATDSNILAKINKIGNMVVDKDSISTFAVSSANKISDWLIMSAVAHKDGQRLREMAELNNLNDYDYSAPDWDIKYVEEVSSDNEVISQNKEEIERDILPTDDNIKDIIENRLNYKYKNQGINNIPVKVAVSEISHKESKERFSKILSKPNFMSEKSMTPTERGTAVHNTLQYIDFVVAKDNLDSEIMRITEKGFITKAQSEVLDRARLQNFLNSEIMAEAINSEKIYREFRFNTKIKASTAVEIPENIQDVDIILQGSVDLAYLKDNKITIVDYKTDRVKSADELKELYHKQLELYKDAMEQCLPYKVDRCIIYSIYSGEFIEV